MLGSCQDFVLRTPPPSRKLCTGALNLFCLVPGLNLQKRPLLPHVERIYRQLGVFQAVLGYLRDPRGDEVLLIGPDLASE